MKKNIKGVAGSIVLVLSMVLALRGAALVIPSGTWAPEGTLATARAGAAASLLQDGRILVTGGDPGTGPVASADFIGADGTISTAPPMMNARSNHITVTLQDGRVLVTGGVTAGGSATSTAEIFDPVANSWTSASVGMTEARSGATAALLPDGRVVIAGGQNGTTISSTIEIFDPTAGAFAAAGMMSSPRTQHAMAVLQDGRILMVGGLNGSGPLASTDIFDPVAGTVSAGPNLAVARFGHSATSLLNGQVVVIGGNNGNANPAQMDLASAELFDPTAGTFTTLATNLATPREGHLAVLLPNNNNVLIIGGTSGGAATASAELFSPWQSTFAATGTMASARSSAAGSANQVNAPSSVMQQNGLMIVAGGSDSSGNALNSTEAYGYATVQTDQSDYAPGTAVAITGSGWTAGETVTLQLVESPLIDSHGPLTTVADANGNIFNDQFVPDAYDVSVRFYLTAVGQSSLQQAQTSFTDAGPKPTSTITFPVNNGSYNSTGWTGTIAGTGTFASGTTGRVVNISVKRNGTTNRYWNGTAFTSSSEVFFAATGTTSWTFSFPFGNFPADDSYTVHSQATDSNGVEPGNTTVTFTRDTIAPAAPSEPSLASGSDTGSSQSDGTTDIATNLKFNGTAEANGTVNLFVDGSSTSAGNGTANNGGNWTNITVASTLTEGTHTIQASATDQAGNVSPLSPALTITIDLTPPAATITAHPTDPSNSTSASFSFTGNDPTSGGVSSGVDHFLCQLDGGGFSTCTSPKAYSGLAAGSHTFEVEAVDIAGNIAAPASFTWNIVTDSTAPTTTIALNPSAPNGSNNWYKTDVGVNVSATDNAGGSGVAETRCVLDPVTAPATFDDIPAGCAYLSPGANVTTEGQHILYAASKDNAGNKETPKSASFKIDKTAPVITKSVPGTPQFVSGPNTYVTSATALRVNINETVSDVGSCTISISGPASTSFSCGNGDNDFTLGGKLTSPADGTYVISVTATDNAGNHSNDPLTVILDNTPPQLTKTIGTPKFVSGGTTYVKSTTPINVAASDTGSGLASCTLQIDGGTAGSYTQGTNFNLPTPDGAHTLVVMCKDNLNNQGAVNETDVVDDTAPAIAKSILSGPQYSNGGNTYVSSGTTLRVSVTDPGSGVQSCTIVIKNASSVTVATPSCSGGNNDLSLSSSLPDGTYTITATATDNVTNATGADSTPLTVILDNTPPVVALTFPSPIHGLNGWFNAQDTLPVAGSVSAVDQTGVTDVGCTNGGLTQGAITFGTTTTSRSESVSGDGVHNISCTATDGLGNTGAGAGSSASATMKIDTAPPLVTFGTPPAGSPYQLNQVVNATFTCSDATSGMAGAVPSSNGTVTGPAISCTGASPIDTASVGSKNYTVTATDLAGNTATPSTSYAVQYRVCLLYDPTRSVKSGATYPLKLYLCDVNGSDVSSSEIIVHATKIFMGSAFTGDPDDAGNSNPDSDFRFDSTLGPSGGYIFNLKTTGLAGGTYGFTFTASNDPTEHTVFPGFGVK